jgi:hypothetical protein
VFGIMNTSFAVKSSTFLGRSQDHVNRIVWSSFAELPKSKSEAMGRLAELYLKHHCCPVKTARNC